jgi:hypothetical protein
MPLHANNTQFTSPPPFQLAVYVLAAMICGFLIGNLLFILISADPESWATGTLSTNNASAQQIRLGLLISHAFTFAIPGIAVLFFFHRTKWWKSITVRPFPGRQLLLVLLFFFAAIPLVGVSVWINLQIPLPDWAVQTEADTSELLQKVLTFESPQALVLAFLAIAVAAGVGEEIIFRGILQGRVFKSLNHHLAIWLAGAIFSLIHLELAGFLPRMVLGAILGYAFYWSGSLLLPILIHICFNGIQVIAAYTTGEFQADTTPVDLPAWYLILGSLVFTFGIGVYLERQSKQEERISDSLHSPL